MDAQSLCNQGNTQVCEQLADLDRDVAQRESQKQPINPNYVSADIDEAKVTEATKDTKSSASSWVFWSIGFILIGAIIFYYSRNK